MKTPVYKKRWFWVLLAIILGSLLLACSKEDPEPKSEESVVEDEEEGQKENTSDGETHSLDARKEEIPSEEDLLTHLRDITKGSSVIGQDDPATATCEAISYDEDKITVELKLTGNQDPEERCHESSYKVATISDELLEYNYWKTYVFKFQDYGSVTFHDSQKTTSPSNSSYFDYDVTENPIRELFGLEPIPEFDSTQSSDFNSSQADANNDSTEAILNLLQSQFADMADVEYNEAYQAFVFTLKGEMADAMSSVYLYKDEPEVIESWIFLVDSFKMLSKSIKENYGSGYQLHILNPENKNNTILGIMDGEVFYNFMDEL